MTTRQYLSDFGLAMIFEMQHQRYNPCKKEMIRQPLLKFLKIFSVKYTVRRIKRQATDLEKMCAKDIHDKRQLFKICKGLLELNNKTMNHLILKWAI
jgi:hypothetical protein